MVCDSCRGAVDGQYFTLDPGQRSLCTSCAEAIDRASSGETGNWWAAAGLGLGAAAVGAGVYYALLALFDLELGLLAFVIGLAVGRAVRKGAGLSRHWGYRAMAVALTFAAIVATYIPLVHGQLTEQGGTLAQSIVLAAMLPFLMLLEGEIFSFIILGIGLWEAYQFSRPPNFNLSGPFQLQRTVQHTQP